MFDIPGFDRGSLEAEHHMDFVEGAFVVLDFDNSQVVEWGDFGSKVESVPVELVLVVEAQARLGNFEGAVDSPQIDDKEVVGVGLV